MNHNSRTKNSIINLIVTLGCQFLTLILNFVVRTYFINILGTSNLGINGLFSNILTVLSLAELGIGSAIGFSLYKPVAENDKDRISALMYFYKKAYRYIAVIVTIVGVILVPFLKHLVKSSIDMKLVIIYYLLYLANTVFSYLLSYKATLLYVDQKNYITRISSTIFNVVQNAAQLAVLFLTRSYVYYIVVLICCTLLNNIVIASVVDKQYSFIKKNKTRLNKDEQKSIFANIKAMFFYKIGGVLVNNTDNILISKIINTATVGFFSNYTLVINSVMTYVDLIIGSATGSIGNFNAGASKKDSQKLFEAVSLFDYWICSFCAVGFYTVINDFITVWLSTTKYLLDEKTLIAIVLNTFIMGVSTSTATFRSTTGLFKETKYIFMFTAVLNIFFSIVLGIKFGLCGIIFATSIAKLLTNFWYEPYMLYNKCFEMSCKTHFLKRGLIAVLTFSCCAGLKYLFSFFPPTNKFILLSKAVIVTVVTNLVFFIVYHKTEEFKFIVSKLKPFVQEKINKYLKRA
ncbi:MAG: oligosaccharide flippase family protein [Clostridia bacterium]|nr:oligosaccharide flippase family protein [Clostridia bacterium]